MILLPWWLVFYLELWVTYQQKDTVIPGACSFRERSESTIYNKWFLFKTSGCFKNNSNATYSFDFKYKPQNATKKKKAQSKLPSVVYNCYFRKGPKAFVLHWPAAAEEGRAPVLGDGGPRDPGPDCGEPSPRTGGTGPSWPPEGLHSRVHGHHIYTEYKKCQWGNANGCEGRHWNKKLNLNTVLQNPPVQHHCAFRILRCFLFYFFLFPPETERKLKHYGSVCKICMYRNNKLPWYVNRQYLLISLTTIVKPENSHFKSVSP